MAICSGIFMNDGQDPAETSESSAPQSAQANDLRGKARGIKTTKKPRRFETALEEIERIVANLEQGQLDLGESLDQYQKGIQTLKECHHLLGEAERRITLLSGFDADGNPIRTSFEEADMTLNEKQSQRGSRRTAERPSTRLSDHNDGDNDDVGNLGLF